MDDGEGAVACGGSEGDLKRKEGKRSIGAAGLGVLSPNGVF
jgi:hypothetical protein